MAAALVESRFRDVAFYITVIMSYIVGVATFRRAELEWRENALNGFLAPIVCAFLVWSDVLTWRDDTCRWIPALLLSYAWGIINSGEFAKSGKCNREGKALTLSCRNRDNGFDLQDYLLNIEIDSFSFSSSSPWPFYVQWEAR